jgi:hypothetical protein
VLDPFFPEVELNEEHAMRAALAFLNGAGSRRSRHSGHTDRGLLALTDLLLNPGIAEKQVSARLNIDARATGRAPTHPSKRFSGQT